MQVSHQVGDIVAVFRVVEAGHRPAKDVHDGPRSVGQVGPLDKLAQGNQHARGKGPAIRTGGHAVGGRNSVPQPVREVAGVDLGQLECGAALADTVE